MLLVRGFVVALALFLAAFALHIVGGATDASWLFAVAVALIFVTAAAFPAMAFMAAGHPPTAEPASKAFFVASAAMGFLLTTSALWAANGRAFAWWQVLVAPALVVAGTFTALALLKFATRLEPLRPGSPASRHR